MTEKIIVKEHHTKSGHIIGQLILNKPKALNALDLDMARAMLSQLTQWQHSEKVLLVLISGAGDKAFCAGGDIVSMYQAMQAHKGNIPSFIREFFETEYRLDFAIHSYPKPVVVWGDGIVMGGGIGLFAGASHRILTAESKLAMPEITIGLYPDVGASYFLPKSPGYSGLFLGLTGAFLNASDARYAGLGDYIVNDQTSEQFLHSLVGLDWKTDSVLIQLNKYCESQETKDSVDSGPLQQSQLMIDTMLSQCSSAEEAVNAILSHDADENSWFKRAQHSLKHGSPITMHLVWQQYHRSQSLSIQECFAMELVMSCRCSESGEFAEGVRALLIDKDKQPKWLFSDVSEVPMDIIERHFKNPWAVNPLSDLGE